LYAKVGEVLLLILLHARTWQHGAGANGDGNHRRQEQGEPKILCDIVRWTTKVSSSHVGSPASFVGEKEGEDS
jgi:hypothetical protein